MLNRTFQSYVFSPFWNGLFFIVRVSASDLQIIFVSEYKLFLFLNTTFVIANIPQQLIYVSLLFA